MSHNILSASEDAGPRDRWLTAASLAFSVVGASRLLAQSRGLVRAFRLALSGNRVEEPLE